MYYRMLETLVSKLSMFFIKSIKHLADTFEFTLYRQCSRTTLELEVYRLDVFLSMLWPFRRLLSL